MWQRWVVDVGITGPDKGQGDKYLFLPPGYKGSIPKGHHAVRSPTFGLLRRTISEIGRSACNGNHDNGTTDEHLEFPTGRARF
jgi:hypothetical protein